MFKVSVYRLWILPILALAGCAGPDFEADLNPLYRGVYHENGMAQTEAAIPFTYDYRTDESERWGVRPLLGVQKKPLEDRMQVDFLPPLGKYASDPNGATARFWPLYWYTRVGDEQGREDVDWILFPILFGGHSWDGENYFAVFPLGGRIRSFLTYDAFDFVLWPLFQHVRYIPSEGGDAYSFLLFLAWAEGGMRDGSFRFLPFYMHEAFEGRYQRYSVLWPFFHYQRNRQDTGHPATLYGFWPLFLYEHSDISYRLGLIGPLFFMGPLVQIASETPPTWKGEPNVNGESYYLYDVPWPLIHLERNTRTLGSRQYEYYRFFPFYSTYHQEGFDSRAWLIPFFWHRWETTPLYSKNSWYFVPFFQSITRTYPDEAGEDAFLQVWPFFHNARGANGDREFSLLSLLPIHTDAWKPVEEALWPFWNLYRYTREAEGDVACHRMLFGLISAYASPVETRFSLPLLYSYRWTETEGWRHDFLWGLISVGGDDRGLKRFRLLFIPFS